MTDRPLLIPTAEGAVGGIVSLPAGEPRAALVLLAGYGAGRAGIDAFWARVARHLAATLGLATLRLDCCREGDTLPVGAEVWGAPRRRLLDLRLLRQVVPWFAARQPGLPLFLAGSCSGGRLAIELAGESPAAYAGLLAVVPHVEELTEVGERPAAPDPVAPQARDALVAALGHMPCWLLTGERDRLDLPALEARLGPVAARLRSEVVPEVALHWMDEPRLQRQTEARLAARLSSLVSPAGAAQTQASLY